MKIQCVICGREINLNHDVFENYMGSVKCFCCSAMMEICTRQGALEAVNLSHVSPVGSDGRRPSPPPP